MDRQVKVTLASGEYTLALAMEDERVRYRIERLQTLFEAGGRVGEGFASAKENTITIIEGWFGEGGRSVPPFADQRALIETVEAEARPLLIEPPPPPPPHVGPPLQRSLFGEG